MNIEKIKAKANELSKLCLSDPETFADEYNKAYESGEFTAAEFQTLLPLCNVYVAVKTGQASRAAAEREQHRLFRINELAAEKEISSI